MDYKEILYNILVTVITAVVPVLTAYLVGFIKKKSEELQNKSNNEYIDATIKSIEDLVTTIVMSLNQTVVDTAKKDNMFTKEVGEEVLASAKKTILSALTDEAKQLIETLYHMTAEEYIEAKIEQAVNATKS